MRPMAYVKLFGSILASTIWAEKPPIRCVWITMLAMADRDGNVEASVPGLAHFAHVSIDECQRAVRVLAGPDVHSRTKTSEGRRIVPIQGGWRIINYEYYRDKANVEERRAADRARQERKRKRDAERNGGGS